MVALPVVMVVMLMTVSVRNVMRDSVGNEIEFGPNVFFEIDAEQFGNGLLVRLQFLFQPAVDFDQLLVLPIELHR